MRFAEINAKGEVKQVIEATQSYIDLLPNADSYAPDPQSHAGIGSKYNPDTGKFTPPKPSAEGWEFDSEANAWFMPPIPTTP